VDDEDLYGVVKNIYGKLKASRAHIDSVQSFLVDRLSSGELREEFAV
jgi:hypothetical protein